MSDNDGKKPLGLGGGSGRSGQVKQSYSHGRTHNVVVETKRKRVVVPGKSGAAAGGARSGSSSVGSGDPSKRPARFCDADKERRMAALKAAKAREVEEAATRAAEEKAREEERERRRAEIEAKEREDREREEMLRAKQKHLLESVHSRKIKVNYHDSTTSFLEGVFAKGDRRLAPVIVEAYKRGCYFDGWEECFKYVTF